MPVVGLNIRQINKLQQIILNPCLSSTGYCNKMPWMVVFGPRYHKGMDWDNPRVPFLYENLNLLIGSICPQNTEVKVLVIHLSWLQVFTGISPPILEYTKIISYTPNGWRANLEAHMVQSTIQVKVHNAWVTNNIARRR